MKLVYLFAAILACSIAGSFMTGRAAKTTFLVVTGALSIYGLARILG